MARYIPKHRKKRTFRDQRKVASLAAVLVAGFASFSGTFGYVPGAEAVDPSASSQTGGDGRGVVGGFAQVRTVNQQGSESVNVANSVLPLPVAAPALPESDRSLPASFFIPSIGVGGELITLGLQADGNLEVPVDFNRVGWYDGSVRPGDIGAAVMAGHVDSHFGPAIFAELHTLKPGDEVSVTQRDGRKLVFNVSRIDRYPKDLFPNNLVYGPTLGPELRLITCGGRFDRKKASYDSNIVVYAKLVSRSA
jgi:Sortase domain